MSRVARRVKLKRDGLARPCAPRVRKAKAAEGIALRYAHQIGVRLRWLERQRRPGKPPKGQPERRKWREARR
jgi:hypothetical protein